MARIFESLFLSSASATIRNNIVKTEGSRLIAESNKKKRLCRNGRTSPSLERENSFKKNTREMIVRLKTLLKLTLVRSPHNIFLVPF